MFKKFILALFVTVFSATIFISCSSDDTSGENNSSYDINPPSWTHGAWGDLMGYTSFYSFYENNINCSYYFTLSWKERYEMWFDLEGVNIRAFDVSKTDNYYEAQYEFREYPVGDDVITGDYLLIYNIKVYKKASESVEDGYYLSITTTITEQLEGEVPNVKIYDDYLPRYEQR